jgi:hypothetical protein
MPADRTETNRANAGRSTGPRSAAGKARSAQNAVRHGLAVPVLADPEVSLEVWELAQRLSAHDGDAELALAVAEAQVDVRRIRTLRHAPIAHALERFATREPVVEAKAFRLLEKGTDAMMKNQLDRAEVLIGSAHAMLLTPVEDPCEREAAVLRNLPDNSPSWTATNDGPSRGANSQSVLLMRCSWRGPPLSRRSQGRGPIHSLCNARSLPNVDRSDARGGLG